MHTDGTRISKARKINDFGQRDKKFIEKKKIQKQVFNRFYYFNLVNFSRFISQNLQCNFDELRIKQARCAFKPKQSFCL